MSEINTIKVAIIDMNKGFANQGMRGIQEILQQYQSQHDIKFAIDIFDIRQKGEVPNLDYQIYISSGGPGSPYDGEGEKWEAYFFDLLDKIDDFNTTHEEKKHAFLICHSFQLACRKYKLGNITRRKSTSFGIFPMSLTDSGIAEKLFDGLNETLYAVDSRDWQVVEPNQSAFDKIGAKLLAIEKERPNVDLERCMMAIRFSPYVIGTQFHPEADPIGMTSYLLLEEKKKMIIENHGQEKYNDMLSSLEDPKRIMLTQSVVLPNFLNDAIY